LSHRSIGAVRVAGLLALAVWVATARAAPPAGSPTTLEGRVVGVTDGDTLTLLVERTPIRIRLAQIDAPESRQPYGGASKRALSALAFGKPARVVVVDTDRYGRSVGEVFVEGVHLNQEMVRQGYAWAYTRYSRSVDIIEIEDEARAENRGLWALPAEQREPPWLWRRQGRTPKQAAPSATPLVCGNRTTCKEMASCREARFYLEDCGVTGLDADRDGVPCEKLCRDGR
jgi:endonuclease YncB( thermonuclease family)